MIERKLSQRAADLLIESNEARKKHIEKPIFIPYQRAADILSEMEDLLEHPKVNRMPNLLILARSNNGKTELLREFLKRHPAEDRKEFDAAYAPVIYIQSPPGPSEHIFLNKLFMMLSAPIKQNDSSDRKLMQVMDLLRAVQTKVLLIDELNALLAGSVAKQRFFLNMLKYISNELQISIVAAGTSDAEHAVSSDKQIKSRFPARKLPLWQEGKDFRKLLYNFEYVLPLREESELYKGEVARLLYGLCEGEIGELVTVIRNSAKHAIDTGVEKITLEVVRDCKHVKRKSENEEEIL